MNIKALLKSKTAWTGIASIIGGVALILTDKQESGLALISTGLSAIFIRDGIEKGINK